MSDRGIAIHYNGHKSTKRRAGAALAPAAARRCACACRARLRYIIHGNVPASSTTCPRSQTSYFYGAFLQPFILSTHNLTVIDMKI